MPKPLEPGQKTVTVETSSSGIRYITIRERGKRGRLTTTTCALTSNEAEIAAGVLISRDVRGEVEVARY